MLKRMLPALFIAGLGTLPLLAQANLDVEELRLPKANSDLGEVASRYQGLIDGLKDKLAAGNEEKAEIGRAHV